MEAIEMCEDCTKRPAEVEIMYSNSDTEALQEVLRLRAAGQHLALRRPGDRGPGEHDEDDGHAAGHRPALNEVR